MQQIKHFFKDILNNGLFNILHISWHKYIYIYIYK